MGKRFVLLDRDGTLIVEKEYLSDPAQVELVSGAGAALQHLQNAGFGLCVISNQSGIARGYFDLASLNEIHNRLRDLLAEYEVFLDGIYFCPHAPGDHCNCRKPRPGLILQAAAALSFVPRDAWMVGDKDVDVEAGMAVGARTVLVRTGYGRDFEQSTRANIIADNLPDAVHNILRENATAESDPWRL